MLATMTIVMCLADAPEVCEVKEFKVDAQICYFASTNAAQQNLTEGYTLRSQRCVPDNRARSDRVASTQPAVL